MDPNRKITKKFTKKFASKVINRQYFHRKTGLQLKGEGYVSNDRLENESYAAT